jgi:SAM-dependent methyltransferase
LNDQAIKKLRKWFSRSATRYMPRLTTLAGRGRWCVYCHNKVDHWQSYRGGACDDLPLMARLDAVGSHLERFGCPHCKSHDRERHLHLFFDRLGIWQSIRGAKVLHMAPEQNFGRAVKNHGPALYVNGDLHPADASVQKINLESIAYPDETFDFVISNHILEHVSNLPAALGEVHRILRRGGRFVCQTPYASRLTKTFEEPLLQTEADRLFFYGQEDHVRLFGLDIEQTIAGAGFVGRLRPHSEILPHIDPDRMGVNEKEPFFDFVRA